MGAELSCGLGGRSAIVTGDRRGDFRGPSRNEAEVTGLDLPDPDLSGIASRDDRE